MQNVVIARSMVDPADKVHNYCSLDRCTLLNSFGLFGSCIVVMFARFSMLKSVFNLLRSKTVSRDDYHSALR